jgi:surface antigen
MYQYPESVEAESEGSRGKRTPQHVSTEVLLGLIEQLELRRLEEQERRNAAEARMIAYERAKGDALKALQQLQELLKNSKEA